MIRSRIHPLAASCLAAFAVAGLCLAALAGCRSSDTPMPKMSPPAASAPEPAPPQGSEGSPPAASAPQPLENAPPADLPKDAKPMEATVDLKNTIRWSTASEVENFGYDVYRAESADGPFVRLTKSPIPGAGTSDEPHKYAYVDRDIDPAKEYWYYVESVAYNGQRERFTPVQKAKAKGAKPNG